MSTPTPAPALSSSQILTPARTYVYLAAVGTAAPESPTGPFTSWTNVGHTTPDSLSFETSPEFDDFTSAQSDYSVKKFQTGDAATVQVDLAQWNTKNLQAVYGGGNVTQVTEGVFKFVPPKLGDHTETAALVHVQEGGKNYLYVFPKAMQTEGVATSLSKGQAATLPLRLDILGGDDTDAWYLLSDDPALTPAS